MPPFLGTTTICSAENRFFFISKTPMFGANCLFLLTTPVDPYERHLPPLASDDIYASGEPAGGERQSPEPEAGSSESCGGSLRRGEFVSESLNVVACLLQAIARDFKFHDDAVMNQAVDRSCSGHRVLEDALPFRERQTVGQRYTAALVAFRQQGRRPSSLPGFAGHNRGCR